MIKKDMKKLYENLYMLSKFSISFVLLICLVALLYIFIINYQNETKISDNNSLVQNELQNDIKNNHNLIKNISDEVKLTQSAILDLKNSLTSFKNKYTNDDILKINENIKNINDNFLSLSEDIDKIKKNNQLISSNDIKKKPNIINDSKNEIIDLIIIKYENNIDFNRELDFLKKISDKGEQSNFEKILILSNNPFKGYKNLKDIFRKETNIFLKKTISKNEGLLLNNMILHYLDVSPSTENDITNSQILLLREIIKNLENKNINKAFNNLKSIDDYDIVFYQTLVEINKYIKFIDAIYKIN
tara:strand:+ start:583 stop:1488 length:906 start_codon:yes stop_codon:yes gene_type:complete